MKLNIDAILAAAESLRQPEPQGRTSGSAMPKGGKEGANAAPKSGAKTKGGAKTKKTTAEPKREKNHLGLFNDYLRDYIKRGIDARAADDPVLAQKMLSNGKSFDGCLNYIGERFYKQACKQRNGAAFAGIGGNDEELVSLAVHYYDECDEDLKKELAGL